MPTSPRQIRRLWIAYSSSDFIGCISVGSMFVYSVKSLEIAYQIGMRFKLRRQRSGRSVGIISMASMFVCKSEVFGISTSD